MKRAAVLLLAGLGWACGTAVTAPPTRRIAYWHDPMHPDYRSDHPGKAPDCGMDLVPVYLDEVRSPPATSPAPVTTTVRLARVEHGSATRHLKAVGRVAPDENRVYPVVAGCEGWITKIEPGAATGDRVRRGQPLATVYGREYATAERSFLYALKASENPPPADESTTLTLEEARRHLQSLGLGDAQIAELERTRKVTLDVVLTAPASGVILSRGAYPRQRFDRDTELFRIADLEHVWIVTELPADAPTDVAAGTVARVTVPGRGSPMTAVTSAALPRFDAASRRGKLRLEADNPGIVLRPDMLVDVELPVVVPDVTTVPATAVAESAGAKTVFVDAGGGRYEPRAVVVGRPFGDRVEIASGLKAGESVVVSGAFLIDAERRKER